VGYILADKAKRALKIEAELNRILEKLKNIDVKKVILFGSAVSGNINSKSDIDLIIVKETNASFLTRIDEIYAAIEPNMAVDILVYTPEEFDALEKTNSFVSRAVKEGRLLYETGFQA